MLTRHSFQESKERDPVFVGGDGPVPCDLMIVGEAPGAEEERLGKPFVGSSGQLLVTALKAAGVSRADVYITNTYKFRPENNRDPSKEEIEKHRPYLSVEVADVNPKAVMFVGKVPIKANFPEYASWKMTELVGMTVRRKGRLLVFNYHPAFLLYSHDPAASKLFLDVVKAFVKGARD